MKKNKLIDSVILPIAVILPALFPLGEATAQQQKQMRPISLLRANCVKSGIGSVRMQKLDISIGKAVYNSKFYLSPGYRSAALTCKIKPDNRPQNVFQALNLGFGMPDNNVNSPSVQLRFYLDGQPTQTVTVKPTQAANLSLNVNNVSNVAIEATCSSSTQYCSRVYFYNADLQRKTPVVNTNPVQEQILEAPRNN
ncbi:hypothetical protein IQ247_00015 [Plectonema cf. radiosum LEGE 06105]|uniref:Uncharacterized protein n=1 Tax=Plectonema cf. radiosum LEGE 06105 TaxID=945769 RepID=A0A8J7F4U1_9CYAN|nr:hypothetical protein [Plectonema radiosum]MBE9211114.1 hypothetical protein [Plectonema cf. radiosum LEGE 06105]